MVKILRLLALLVFGSLTLTGCSRQGKRIEDFTPSEDQGRKALESALNHWKSGQQPGRIPGTTPAVEVLDSKWKSGQKLSAYEILGEEAGSEPRFFKVRLTLANGPAQEVRYTVIGIDPLWVYREEDYKSLSGIGK